MPRPALLLAALLAWLFLPVPAQAQCAGTNLIDALPPADRAVLRDAAAAVPYPSGNLWRATRGMQTLHLVGTYHLDDPRNDTLRRAIAPLLATATTLLVEAGPAEVDALEERIAHDPGILMITEGPALPDLLPQAEWQALSAALRARGIPAVMGARMQPWFVSMMLGVAPCDMASGGAAVPETVAPETVAPEAAGSDRSGADTDGGLDRLLIDAALARGVPVRALEPYDTLVTLFRGLTPQDQLAMVRSALATEPQAADLSVTLADAYFAGESRLIWEFTRQLALQAPGGDPDRAARDLAVMEAALMTGRNRAWMPVILDAVAKGPAVAAFGALHLSGEQGVLNLLAQQGFALQRLPVAQ